MRRLTFEMVRESSAPCIRQCGGLLDHGGATAAFAREIFPVVFLSCWVFLSACGKRDLSHCIAKALASAYTSPRDLHQLLNLSEAMSLQGEELPIDLDIFMRATERCHAYAKALRYKELHGFAHPESSIEPLMSAYYSLQQKDAALGVLTYAQKYLNVTFKESWSEKLQRWTMALELYDTLQLADPSNVEWLKGRMRCLYALGHWDRVSLVASAVCESSESRCLRDPRDCLEFSSIAAAAELNLRNYERMAFYVQNLKQRPSSEGGTQSVPWASTKVSAGNATNKDTGDTFDAAFFNAILQVHAGRFTRARESIKKARDVLHIELTALLGESYARAYRTLVKAQQLVELEEAIWVKEAPHNLELRSRIQNLWACRLLEGNQPETDVWHSILQVRGTVFAPHEDISTWLKFASLSRREERFGIAFRVVEELRKHSSDPRVYVAFAKNLFATGNLQRALLLLRKICSTLSATVGLIPTESKRLSELLSVSKHFPVAELMSLANHMKKLDVLQSAGSPACSAVSVKRVVSPALLERLSAEKMLGSNPSPEAQAYFAGFGLSTLDVDLLLASCYLKLASWTEVFYAARDSQEVVQPGCRENRSSGALREIMVLLRTAIRCCPETQKVWKGWADMNFQLSQRIDRLSRIIRYEEPAPSTIQHSTMQKRASGPAAAVLGFERCPALRALEDAFIAHTGSSSSRPCCRCPCHSEASRRDAASSTGPVTPAHTATVLGHYHHRNTLGSDHQDPLCVQAREHLQFVVEAAGGLIRYLSLRPTGHNIQDVLRLLTLWFQHADVPEVIRTVKEGFRFLPVRLWLPVIPQILARLKTTQPALKVMVRTLIRKVAAQYPESLIFPLIASASRDVRGEDEGYEASALLQAIARRHPVLVLESQLVSQELVRVSILNIEKWRDVLEEASSLYTAKKNIPRMVNLLLEMYENSLKEQKEGLHSFGDLQFAQRHGRDLGLASHWLYHFVAANQDKALCGAAKAGASSSHDDGATPERVWNHVHDLDHAWQILYRVFFRLTQQINAMSRLDLESVSPRLKAATNLCIAVPGRYSSRLTYPKIAAFDSRVAVFPSKQRPRKISITGSDGQEYAFLVKGHEDLRQDERVMQVLILINRLLVTECFRASRFRRRLQRKTKEYDSLSLDPEMDYFNDTIGREGIYISATSGTSPDLVLSVYSVVPLAANSGIIEWVPRCDTLHYLIKRYRELHNIRVSLESDLLRSLYPKYETLSLLQKIDAFQYALDRSSGNDLREILWKTSRSSEAWLRRRSNFTTSLALMSIVGYILGLGDRHPSNLMIHQITGAVVHIDFGDCFEIAMFRDRFPEKIPFRLTRMLLNGMEIGGLEGRYRLVCERVARLLRANRDAVVATLETFLYDPLVTWKLLLPQHQKLERFLRASAMSQQLPLPSLYKEIIAETPTTERPSAMSPVARCLRCRHCNSSTQKTTRSRRPRVSAHLFPATETQQSRRSTRKKLVQLQLPFFHLRYHPIRGCTNALSVSREMLDRVLASNCTYPHKTECVDEWDLDSEASTSWNHHSCVCKDNGSRARVGRPCALKTRSKNPCVVTSAQLLRMLENAGAVRRVRRLRSRWYRVPRQHSRTNGSSTDQVSPLTATARTTAETQRTSKTCVWRLQEEEDFSVTNAALLSQCAEMVLERIETKLNGTDFGRKPLDVPTQVKRLILEATSKENLAQCFVGWCPFW